MGTPREKISGSAWGRVSIVDAVGSAGEDDADGVNAFDLVQSGIGVGLDLAVDAAFADAARDELVVLAAEIQNDDFLHREDLPFLFVVRWKRTAIRLPAEGTLSRRPGIRCCPARRFR
jgi:hypothetical protein